MRREAAEHYEQLAEAYDENWTYSPAYVRKHLLHRSWVGEFDT